jgi:hypothetical protein
MSEEVTDEGTLVRLSRGLGMRFRVEITPEELALGA